MGDVHWQHLGVCAGSAQGRCVLAASATGSAQHPQVVHTLSPPVQVALYSNGPTCGVPFLTSFYTDLRLPAIRDWLDTQLAAVGGSLD